MKPIHSSLCLTTLALLIPSLAAGNDTATNKVIVFKSLELMRGRDTNAFAVYSVRRQRWSTHRFPSHLTISPLTLGEGLVPMTSRDGVMPSTSPPILGFSYSGGTVRELVAVDTKGRFRTFNPEQPIRRELYPVLNGHSILYYIADETIYAFSGRTGTWDSLHVPGVPDVEWKDGTVTVPDVQKHGFDSESTDGIVVTLREGEARFMPDRGFWKIKLNSQPDSGTTANAKTDER